ncbi:MAG: carbonic anhydrase [Deltaproteobacteria bacterium]|nr:MAG: carbonic anhydrase [Deltaproteobacteria bacterium]
MKKCITLSVLLLAAALCCGAAVASEDAVKTTPEQALRNLMDGNRRYVEQQMSGVRLCAVGERQKLSGAQAPYAIILSCSDSRVPPELVFDEGLGEIFVVRVAGNVVDPIVLGSIEYAAEHLGSPLIMVLGHERCGAVKATVEAKGKGHGNIGAIVGSIAPALKTAPKSEDKAQYVENVVAENITLVKSSLIARSPVLAALVKEGKLKIVTAKYDLDDGGVTLLENLK